MYVMIERVIHKFRPKKKVKPTVYTRYGDLRKGRQGRFSKPNFYWLKPLLLMPVNLFKKIPIAMYLVVIIAGFSILGGYYVLTSDSYSISNIKVNEGDATMQSVLGTEFTGQNIFLVSDDEIYQNISSNITNLDEVYISRQLPNTIVVEYSQRIESYFITTYEGYCIYDQYFIVLKCNLENALTLTDYEVLIKSGTTSYNDDFIKEKYLSALSREERAEVDWDDVPKDVKKNLYKEVQNEVSETVRNYFLNQVSEIKESYGELTGIEIDCECRSLNEQERVNRLIVSEEIRRTLGDVFGQVDTFRLYTPFDYRINTDSKYFLLTVRRDTNDQMRDLIALKSDPISSGSYDSAKGVDLRSTKLVLVQ